MLNRRSFIKRSTTGTLMLASGGYSFAAPAHDLLKLTILHTNDMHSRVEPFPMDGSRNEGLGGLARRAGMITKIKEREDHVLLLDAGDIFQGTPYFNFFSGEIEMKAMSKMGYDASAIGNHDFDGGIVNLKKQLDIASFPMICANYDFNNTILHNQIIPHKIFQVGKIKSWCFRRRD